MNSVRQKVGPAVSGFAAAGIKFGQRNGYATVGGDAKQRTANAWRKNDSALSVPRAAPPQGSVTDFLYRTARGQTLFELAFGKEANPLTVRRPEWEAGVISPYKDLSGKRIQRADPEASLPVH